MSKLFQAILNLVGWGQGAKNNTKGFGQGAKNNTVGWGIMHSRSHAGQTNIDGKESLP